MNDIYVATDGQYKIIHYVDSLEIVIKFIDTGYETTVTSTQMNTGKIKDKLKPKVLGIGYIGVGKYKSSTDASVYRVWRKILKECCVEWRNFQVFCQWFYDNKKENSIMKRWDDTLYYSPINCCFLKKNNLSLA